MCVSNASYLLSKTGFGLSGNPNFDFGLHTQLSTHKEMYISFRACTYACNCTTFLFEAQDAEEDDSSLLEARFEQARPYLALCCSTDTPPVKSKATLLIAIML